MVTTTIVAIVAIVSYAATVSEAGTSFQGRRTQCRKLRQRIYSHRHGTGIEDVHGASDPKTSIELSENQCATVFDTASSMIDNTKLGGKCLTDEFAVQLSSMITAAEGTASIPDLGDGVCRLSVPPLGTVAVKW